MGIVQTVSNAIRSIKEQSDQNSKTLREIHMFGILDTKANEFIGPPFFQPNPTAAVRTFTAEINRQHDQNMLYLYPDEYELHYLGTFDQVSGEISPTIEKLMNGKTVKKGA